MANLLTDAMAGRFVILILLLMGLLLIMIPLLPSLFSPVLTYRDARRVAHALSPTSSKGDPMTNHHLILAFSKHPLHPVHRIRVDHLFLRWLNLPCQPLMFGGTTVAQVRQTTLDLLYNNWQAYRLGNIDPSP